MTLQNENEWSGKISERATDHGLTLSFKESTGMISEVGLLLEGAQISHLEYQEPTTKEKAAIDAEAMLNQVLDSYFCSESKSNDAASLRVKVDIDYWSCISDAKAHLLSIIAETFDVHFIIADFEIDAENSELAFKASINTLKSIEKISSLKRRALLAQMTVNYIDTATEEGRLSNIFDGSDADQYSTWDKHLINSFFWALTDMSVAEQTMEKAA